MSNSVTITTKDYDKWFKTVGNPDWTNAVIYYALRSGGKGIQLKARELFKSKMGESATHHSPWVNWGQGGELFEGIQISGHKDAKEVSVSIMGDYRLKWFEAGTEVRYKGARNRNSTVRDRLKSSGAHSTGAIKPLYFFKQAVENSTLEQTIMQSVQNAFDKIEHQ